MKRKTTIAVLASMIINCISVIPVSAAEIGWEVIRSGDAVMNTQKYKADKFNRYKFDGEYSMSMECLVGSKNPDNYIEIKTPLLKSAEPGEYTLTFYSKGTSSDTTIIYVGNTEITYGELTKSSAVAPNGESGWSEYSKSITLTETAEYLSFRYYSRTDGELLDNISFVSGGVNYIPDSGFEGVEIIPPGPDGPDEPVIPDEPDEPVIPDEPKENEYAKNEYYPVNVLTSSAGGMLVLSWRNPASDNLIKTEIYDVTSDESVFISDDVPVTPSEFVYRKIEGLTDGLKYKYKLVFTFSSGKKTEYYTDGTPTSSTVSSIGGWNVNNNSTGKAGYSPAVASIDTDVSHSGEASVKVSSNINKSLDEFKSNIFLNIQRTLPVQAGKKYKLSLWVKANNMSDRLFVHMNYANFDGYGKDILSYTDYIGTYDWKYKEFTFTASKDILMIGIDCAVEEIWIDDIECYEIDGDGNPVTGENIVSQGGFENIASAKVGEISGFEADAGIRKATLSWETSKSDYSGAYIYCLEDGKYVSMGQFAADVKSVVINGLENDTEYTFRLVPFNSGKVRGIPVDVTFTVPLPDYETGELVLTKNGIPVTELDGSGVYKITVPVKNNSVAEGLPYEQMVFVYKGRMLEKVYSSKLLAQMTSPEAPFYEVETSFEVPEGEDVSVGIFIHNTREEMEWYKQPVTVK